MFLSKLRAVIGRVHESGRMCICNDDGCEGAGALSRREKAPRLLHVTAIANHGNLSTFFQFIHTLVDRAYIARLSVSFVLVATFLIGLGLFTDGNAAYVNGPPPATTGGFKEDTCRMCHIDY